MSQREENIRNKTAAALKYDPTESDAPIIVGLGTGHMAQRMVEQAQDNDVPVVENSEAADILRHLSIGDEIPPELYEVVAEILVFVAKLNDNHAKNIYTTGTGV